MQYTICNASKTSLYDAPRGSPVIPSLQSIQRVKTFATPPSSILSEVVFHAKLTSVGLPNLVRIS